MASIGLPNVVRFPRECPQCHAITAMPLSAGTLAEGRTQVNLKCDHCRHEWAIEMTPPVVIVKPDRQTDGADSAAGNPSAPNLPDDRRHLQEMQKQRMRVGLCGLLTSADRAHTVPVLYSLDAHRVSGRLRPLDPSHLFPPWLDPDSRPELSGYDGVPLPICITVVKLTRDGWKDDDRFAEFVVRQVAH